jgi:hypothetical protein
MKTLFHRRALLLGTLVALVLLTLAGMLYGLPVSS